MVSARVKWEDFFKQAGIPAKPATDYAIIFSDNRMQLDMLDELNKELLHDLGVKAIGDVIAILRYAKIKQAEVCRKPFRSQEVMARQRSPTPELVETSKPSSSQVKETGNKHMAKVPQSANSKPIATKAEVTKNVSTVKTRGVSEPAFDKSVSKATVSKATEKQSSKTKVKPRKTLSQRFQQYEEERKRSKEDEKSEVKKLPQDSTSITKSKNKGTIFTIQVPSKPPISSSKQPNSTPKQSVVTPKQPVVTPKQPVITAKQPSGTSKQVVSLSKQTVSIVQKASPAKRSAVSSAEISNQTVTFKMTETKSDSKSKPSEKKVTLVPAQGKQVDPTERAQSIFDRLDKSKPLSDKMEIDSSATDKKNVFKRLGNLDESPTQPKVQKVTAIIRPDQMERASASTSVFSRLGER